MSPDLTPGLRHVQRLAVSEAMTVPALAHVFSSFADMPPVLATAVLVAFLEWACIESLRPYLAESERTVGTHVHVSHVAATPVGLTLEAEVELLEIRGRTLRFRVVCRDGVDTISEGFHERVLIDAPRFLARMAAKAAAHAQAAGTSPSTARES